MSFWVKRMPHSCTRWLPILHQLSLLILYHSLLLVSFCWCVSMWCTTHPHMAHCIYMHRKCIGDVLAAYIFTVFVFSLYSRQVDILCPPYFNFNVERSVALSRSAQLSQVLKPNMCRRFSWVKQWMPWTAGVRTQIFLRRWRWLEPIGTDIEERGVWNLSFWDFTIPEVKEVIRTVSGVHRCTVNEHFSPVFTVQHPVWQTPETGWKPFEERTPKYFQGAEKHPHAEQDHHSNSAVRISVWTGPYGEVGVQLRLNIRTRRMMTGFACTAVVHFCCIYCNRILFSSWKPLKTMKQCGNICCTFLRLQTVWHRRRERTPCRTNESCWRLNILTDAKTDDSTSDLQPVLASFETATFCEFSSRLSSATAWKWSPFQAKTIVSWVIRVTICRSKLLHEVTFPEALTFRLERWQWRHWGGHSSTLCFQLWPMHTFCFQSFQVQMQNPKPWTPISNFDC